MKNTHLKFCVVCMLCFLGITEIHAQVKIKLKEDSGNQAIYTLSDIRKITFSTGNIIVTNSEGTSELTNINCLNFKKIINELQETQLNETKISLFPNPVIDVLNLQLSSMAASTTGRIEILTLEGKVVYSQALNNEMDVYKIHVSDLPKGLYVCKVNNGICIKTVKFIKH